MVRVLQMISQCPDWAAAHHIELLSSGLSADIELCRFPLECRFLRYQLFAGRFRSRLPGPDVIHVWDSNGLKLALAATNSPILYSVQALQFRSQVLSLGRLARMVRRIAFVCSTLVQKQMLERAGIASHRCYVIEPGVASAPVSHEQRMRLRQSLGLGSEDVVAFAPGDSTPTARHRLSLWAISILHVYDRRYRLLISGTGKEALSLHRLAHKLKQPAVLVSPSGSLGRAVDQRQLLAASDVALATDSLAGTPLPMAMCMTARMPMIGDGYGLAGQCASEDASTILLRPLRPKLLARHILELFPIGGPRPDPLCNIPPRSVERFDPVRFRRQMCDVYRAVQRSM